MSTKGYAKIITDSPRALFIQQLKILFLNFTYIDP